MGRGDGASLRQAGTGTNAEAHTGRDPEYAGMFHFPQEGTRGGGPGSVGLETLLLQFWKVRSRLYRSRIFEVSVRFAAIFKFYKICTLLHRSNRLKNQQFS